LKIEISPVRFSAFWLKIVQKDFRQSGEVTCDVSKVEQCIFSFSLGWIKICLLPIIANLKKINVVSLSIFMDFGAQKVQFFIVTKALK
jgi:hypothetical protein